MSETELANFLGWCTLLNLGLLVASTVALWVARKPVAKLHARLFGIDADKLPAMYFQYLANYKIAIIVFNLVPYLALRILAS